MLVRPERAIARVLAVDGTPVGLAFAVARHGCSITEDHLTGGGHQLVTCAHVVNAALGRSLRDASDPGPVEFSVEFEFGGAGDEPARVPALLGGWLPGEGAFDRHDAAGMRLVGDLPVGVIPLRIDSSGPHLPLRVQMWGPAPRLRATAGHVTGHLMGGVEKGRYQVDQEQRGIFRVVRGFSGGPVWRPDTGEVVGLLQASSLDDRAVDAYVLGTEVFSVLTRQPQPGPGHLGSASLGWTPPCAASVGPAAGGHTATGPAASVTILHLPDLRFGQHHRFGSNGLTQADRDTDSLVSRLLADLGTLRERHGLIPDLVVAAGDLTESGLPSEFEAAHTFLTTLIEGCGLGLDRMVLVPGNHDVNRKRAQAYVLRAEADGDVPLRPYWPMWQPYDTMLNRLTGLSVLSGEPWTYHEIPALNVAVAALNSTMADSHDPGDHHGELGEQQLRSMRARLRTARHLGWLRLAVVHHSPAVPSTAGHAGRLRDADRLDELLGSDLHLLLHGHSGDVGIGRTGPTGLVTVGTGSAGRRLRRPAAALVDPAASSLDSGGVDSGHQSPVGYRLVEVHRHGIRVWARAFHPRRRRFISDAGISDSGEVGYRDIPIQHTDARGIFP